VLAAAPAAFEQAFRSLRPGGRLVLVGLPADNEMRLPIFETVLNGIQLVGSIVGTRVDLAEVFELHARDRTHVTYQRRPLESVNDSFAEVLAGRIPARIVLEPPQATTTQ
jgi:propanol-preferring alcohol dehydrogenase